MYNSRIKFAIDNFIKEKYFTEMKNIYDLKEESKEGKSILTLTVNGKNICVEEYDNDQIHGKCNFLKIERDMGLKKCIDHFILKENGSKWDLHMIEMKTGVGYSTWDEIKKKNRSSYFNIMALCTVLGIELKGVYSYTTYEHDKFESFNGTTNPKIYTPLLGGKPNDFKKDEWDKDLINISLGDKGEVISFPHKAIQMNRNSDGILQGVCEI